MCAVKRKFRVPGQAFADNIGTLINFIESHPMVKASGLVEQLLGFAVPAAPAAPRPAPKAPAPKN